MHDSQEMNRNKENDSCSCYKVTTAIGPIANVLMTDIKSQVTKKESGKNAVVAAACNLLEVQTVSEVWNV